MKIHFFFLALILIILISCSKNNTRSDASGNFESEPVLVSAEISGKVVALEIERGMTISEGILTARIDTTTILLQINQLHAQKAAIQSKNRNISSQIEVLEVQKKNIQTNIDRTKNMLVDGASTQKQLDDLNSQLELLEKQIESTGVQFGNISAETAVIDAQLEIAADQLRRTRVYSPIPGTILETYVRQGELVAPGKPLFKIADLSTLTLKVFVSGSQLSSVILGEKATVLAGSNAVELRQYEGKITWISPEAEFTPKNIQTREERLKLVYAVKVAVKNDGSLKMGMPGEIIIGNN